jgi:hypothetical protein
LIDILVNKIIYEKTKSIKLGTVPKSRRKIVKIDTSNIKIHDGSLSRFGAATSI